MGSKHTKKGHYKKGENMFNDKWIRRKNDKLQRMRKRDGKIKELCMKKEGTLLL